MVQSLRLTAHGSLPRNHVSTATRAVASGPIRSVGSATIESAAVDPSYSSATQSEYSYDVNTIYESDSPATLAAITTPSYSILAYGYVSPPTSTSTI